MDQKKAIIDGVYRSGECLKQSFFLTLGRYDKVGGLQGWSSYKMLINRTVKKNSSFVMSPANERNS